ncbi:AI-2E family transporter [Ralstonia solanacearum]|uniref:AI-2E family transporter n=1 Tax=Ralstonia solanacearum TaxID=305 RepID=A0AAE3NFF6_RALSL|nr:AI-2E family transporter [Ralstonia solanacearum]KFX28295.1 permease [Ralstonia solanacearum]MDB0520940.1 AI-2E family transporter [Ralstonia solanacearum]
MTKLPHPLPSPSRTVDTASYVLVAAMIVAVLWLHLLPAAIAGFLVYALARRLEARLRARRTLSKRAKSIAVTGVFLIAALILAAIGLGIGRLVEHGHGLDGMLLRIADVLDHLRDSLPPTIADYVPQSVSELRARLVEMIKEHGHQVSTLGIDGLRASAMALVGLILGAMMAWSETPDPARSKPLSAALLHRLGRLETAFEAVVFAQVKISALNTALAAIYLMGVVPALGLHVPYSKSLVLLTFVAGLIPVAGNLISNTAIVLMSVAVSLELAVGSLAFLVIVHKLEYFVNARIIGSRIDARAWELILALIVMEALFGVGGVIAAPVLYAYLKRELSEAGLIG